MDREKRFYFEQIEPLISRIDRDREVLIFTFHCPVTGLETEAPIVPGETMLAPPRPAKSGFFSLLESLFGGDSNAPWEGSDYDKDDVEEAAEDAFRCVSNDFVWEGTRWVWWEANDRVVQFHEVVEQANLQEPFLRSILHRMLAEILHADGEVADSELELLNELTGSRTGAGHYKPLEAVDLSEVARREDRHALLVLASAMACCDGELHPLEEKRLEELGDLLDVPRLKSWELKKAAQFYFMDGIFHRLYLRDPSEEERLEAYRMAAQVGMEPEETEMVEFRYLKRSEVEMVPEA